MSETSRYYADSTCETRRLTLLEVWGYAPTDGFSHVHTADEIMRLTIGQIRIGRAMVEASRAKG